jgi:hypothetical protein
MIIFTCFKYCISNLQNSSWQHRNHFADHFLALTKRTAVLLARPASTSTTSTVSYRSSTVFYVLLVRASVASLTATERDGATDAMFHIHIHIYFKFGWSKHRYFVLISYRCIHRVVCNGSYDDAENMYRNRDSAWIASLCKCSRITFSSFFVRQ